MTSTSRYSAHRSTVSAKIPTELDGKATRIRDKLRAGGRTGISKMDVFEMIGRALSEDAKLFEKDLEGMWEGFSFSSRRSRPRI